MWCKQLGDEIFELCCIPIYTHGLALGDRVSVRSGDRYMIDRVVVPSGHQTFRAFVPGGIDSGVPRRLAWAVAEVGGLIEPYSDRLYGVDAPDEAVAAGVRKLLEAMRREGVLEYEDGSVRRDFD